MQTTLDTGETARSVLAAMKDRDFEAFGAALAPDVVLHSPITGAYKFEGREEVVALVKIVRELFEDLRADTYLGEGETQAAMFQARVRGVDLEGMDVLTFDEEGRVSELRIFVRPLPAATALMAGLAGPLARRGGRVAPMLIGPPTRMQAFVARVGDRVALRVLRRAFRRPG
jgi:hypothetical protein